jgi:hypothetical protein
MTSLKKLRELAMAASKGPWISRDHLVDSPSGFICECFEDEDPQQSRTDTAFIAAFNPQTILKLLDEVEAARAMVDASIIEDGPTLYPDTTAFDTYQKIRKQNESDL